MTTPQNPHANNKYPEADWDELQNHFEQSAATEHAAQQIVESYVQVDPVGEQAAFDAFKTSPAHGLTPVEAMRAEIDAKLPAWEHGKHLRDYSKNHGGRRPLPGALGDPKPLSTK